VVGPAQGRYSTLDNQSSLLRCLHRLGVYEGTILIDKQDITAADLIQLRQLLPTVTQASLSIQGSLTEAVDPGNLLSEEQVRQVLADVHMDLPVSTSLSTLSVGELQLVSFARAVASVTHFGAKILLLDEASSSIDVLTETVLTELLFGRLAGITMIIVAHRLQTILNCDEIVVMVRLADIRQGARLSNMAVRPS
jgi:ABC-type multidrug transport system fused ATPase/permease subunit